MKKTTPKPLLWSAIIGNILDHYDSALYAFLAPFLAPIFFPNSDPIIALIMTYGIKSATMVTRPIGSLIFGYLAMKFPVRNIFAYTLIGVATSTFLIGIIPSYKMIGIFSPILLAVARGLQGIFAAGEHTIAALFFIGINQNVKHSKSSSIYLCSTMAGSFCASFAAAIVSMSSEPTFYWRFAFVAGLLTALCSIYIRMSQFEIIHPLSNIKRFNDNGLYKPIIKNKFKLFKITIITSFSFLTYSLPFIFFNNFIPLLSDIKISSLLSYNTILLCIDIALIPIFGFIANKIQFNKLMSAMCFLLAFSIIPIFHLLPHLKIMEINLVKLWIIVLGVGFTVPLYGLLYRMMEGSEKYLITGFGYSIGTDILGRNIPIICLALWNISKNLTYPALFIAFISLLSGIILIKEDRVK